MFRIIGTCFDIQQNILEMAHVRHDLRVSTNRLTAWECQPIVLIEQKVVWGGTLKVVDMLCSTSMSAPSCGNVALQTY
jgi:hypothetical protein